MDTQQQSKQTIKVKARTRLQRACDTATVLALASVPMIASAAPPANLDMSKGTTQLGLGLAAVGTLGAAKLAPSALTWTWSLVTGMARRG